MANNRSATASSHEGLAPDLQTLLDQLPSVAFAASASGALLGANERASVEFASGGPWVRGELWWTGCRDAARVAGEWAASAGSAASPRPFAVSPRDGFELRASPILRSIEGAPVWLVVGPAPAVHADSPLSEPDQLVPALNAALHAGGMGLWKWDPSSDAAYWSPELYDLLRLPRGGGIEAGSRFRAMVRDEDAPVVESLIETLLRDGAAGPAQFRVTAGDGSERWLVSSAQRVSGAGGAAGFVGVNFDVTDQVEARRRAAAAELLRDRHRRVVESLMAHAPIGLALAVNGEQELSLVSAHGLAMIEVDAERGRAWDAWQVYRPDGVTPVAPDEMALHRAARGEVIRNEDWLIRRADGALLPVRASAGPIRGDDGAPIGGVVAWYDVSAFREAELERQRALEAEVAARAAAEESSRQKDIFLGVVSHELRTPLGSILGWTEILKRSGASGADRGVAAIERSAKALARLVDDLLDVTRIAVGKLPMAPRPADFADIVEAAFDMVHPMALGAGVVLQRRPLRERAPARVDPLRMQQAIWNLLTNAVKFSAEGGLVLVVEEIEGDEVVLRVSDYGMGIEPEHLPRVFDRFWQDSESPQRAGLGLGLYIAKHVVEQHGGRLSAQSSGIGRGATFTMRIPLSR